MIPSRVAIERPGHRCDSPIGTAQRHYALHPGFASARGQFNDVAVIVGLKSSTYLYEADAQGNIISFDPLTIVTAQGPELALSQLGYEIAFDARDAS